MSRLSSFENFEDDGLDYQPFSIVGKSFKERIGIFSPNYSLPSCKWFQENLFLKIMINFIEKSFEYSISQIYILYIDLSTC